MTSIPTTIRAVKDSKSLKRGRTLVICLDGTGDKFDNDNSNVVKLVACLKKDDPSQITYYQSGIGTYDDKGGLKKGFSAAFDMAIGSGLGIHVKDAYLFLMQNYQEGDRICLFGFSRGSYTVRCLAGMLHKVGLLPADNQAQLSFAYKMYKDGSLNGQKMSEEFKKTFCMDVTVYFIGVWDCVASVGFIPKRLPFSKSPKNTIAYFRHAMALDERRSKFEVCPWGHQDDDYDHDVFDNTLSTRLRAHSRQAALLFVRKQHRILGIGNGTRPEHLGNKQDTDVKEVWFMGCHADVGGGAVANDERHMLSRIPLRWMIRQCFECDTGILFNAAAMAEKGMDIRNLWPVYQPPTQPTVGPSPRLIEQYEKKTLPPIEQRSAALIGDVAGEFDILPEHIEDHFDALASINDQLILARPWWILEFWPVKLRILRKMDEGNERWEKILGFNLGRHRAIRVKEPSLHWTVKLRENEMEYEVKSRVGRECMWKVVA